MNALITSRRCVSSFLCASSDTVTLTFAAQMYCYANVSVHVRVVVGKVASCLVFRCNVCPSVVGFRIRQNHVHGSNTERAG